MRVLCCVVVGFGRMFVVGEVFVLVKRGAVLLLQDQVRVEVGIVWLEKVSWVAVAGACCL